MLLNATEQGIDALQTAWMKTPPTIRKALGDKFKDQLKAAALAYDAARTTAPVPESIELLNREEKPETTVGDVF
jgi:hypothetical protein